MVRKNLPATFCHAAVRYIATVATGLIFLLNSLFTADVFMDTHERVTVGFSPLDGLVGIAIVSLLLAVAWLMKYKAWHVPFDEKRLYWLCVGVYGVAAVYLILNVSGDIRDDAAQTFADAAAYGVDGNYAALQDGGYIHMYPNQLGLMTYDRLLQRFSPHPKVFFVVNFLLVLVNNAILYKTADCLFHHSAVNKVTILLSFAFLPPLFFILFAYGLIPGLCAISAAFYYALRLEKTRQWRYFALTVLFCAVAVVLKQNFLIGAVALVLYFLLRLLRHGTWQSAVAMVVVMLCAVLPNRLLPACYEHNSGASLQDGTPWVLWVAMGTDIDNTERAAGWYNGYNYVTYLDSADAAEAAEKGKEKLRENVEKIQADPWRAAEFFALKTIAQWCEPMCQADWSGPLADRGQETSTALLQDFYSGGQSNAVVSAWTKTVTLCIWGFALLFMLFYAAQTTGWEPAFMYFIGGLLFHTVWEGKSQYILPYVVLIIPFSAYAICRVIAALPQRKA